MTKRNLDRFTAAAGFVTIVGGILSRQPLRPSSCVLPWDRSNRCNSLADTLGA